MQKALESLQWRRKRKETRALCDFNQLRIQIRTSGRNISQLMFLKVSIIYRIASQLADSKSLRKLYADPVGKSHKLGLFFFSAPRDAKNFGRTSPIPRHQPTVILFLRHII